MTNFRYVFFFFNLSKSFIRFVRLPILITYLERFINYLFKELKELNQYL